MRGDWCTWQRARLYFKWNPMILFFFIIHIYSIFSSVFSSCIWFGNSWFVTFIRFEHSRPVEQGCVLCSCVRTRGDYRISWLPLAQHDMLHLERYYKMLSCPVILHNTQHVASREWPCVQPVLLILRELVAHVLRETKCRSVNEYTTSRQPMISYQLNLRIQSLLTAL